MIAELICGCALWLNINGLSDHPNSDNDYNEVNRGLGVAVENIEDGRWHGSLSLDIYRDSYDRGSGHAMQSYMYRVTEHLSIGGGAGILHRKDVEESTGTPVIPFVAPLVRVGTEHVAVRTVVVPSLDSLEPAVIAAQLQVRM